MKTGGKQTKEDLSAKMGLLDRIAFESGCMYVSDLRNCTITSHCRIAVTIIPASDYPVKVWEDAVYYMIGIEEKFETSEQAKTRLLEYL